MSNNAADGEYTCPSVCVEQNHPGREHNDWIAESGGASRCTP